jgi:hypothetical protein
MSDPLALAAARYASEILMMPKRCGYVNAKRMPQAGSAIEITCILICRIRLEKTRIHES